MKPISVFCFILSVVFLLLGFCAYQSHIDFVSNADIMSKPKYLRPGITEPRVYYSVLGFFIIAGIIAAIIGIYHSKVLRSHEKFRCV